MNPSDPRRDRALGQEKKNYAVSTESHIWAGVRVVVVVGGWRVGGEGVVGLV